MTRRRLAVTSVFGVLGAVALIAAGVLAWARPRPAPGPLDRGLAAYDRRDWEAASTLAAEALKAKPDGRDALRLYARSSGRLGRDDAARAVYKRLGSAGMGAEDYLVIAAGLQRQGDLGSAFRSLEAGHKLDPDHADTLHDLSRFCASKDKLIRAEGLAERLANLPGQGARAGVLLAAIRDRLSDPGGAAGAMQEALRLDPDLHGLDPAPPEARKLLARDYLRIGNPGLARDQLSRLADARPDPEAAWLLSRAWLQEGRTDEAASSLKLAGGYGADRPLAPEPAPYVGSAECAGCHPAIHRAEQASRHARTFMADAGLGRLVLPRGPVPDPGDPVRIDHRATRDGDRVVWETRVDGEVARAVVQYAFGSGDRGVTPIGRGEDGVAKELRLSRYGDIDGWDLTAGHPARPGPASAESALGRPLDADDLRNCIGCHTTDFRASRDRVGPLGAEGGIGCERCHGPGGNHLKSAAAGFSDPAIARPRLAAAEDVTRLCAECHSPPGRAVLPTDPDAARFQGTTLPWSRCYQESRGGLSCVTCHDPHHDAGRSPAPYESKCLACHSSASKPADNGMRVVPCPVNPSSGCLKCHMPPRDSAVPHTTFTDHHIRVQGPPVPSR